MRKNNNSKLLITVLIAIGFSMWGIECHIDSPTVVTNNIVWERTNGPYGGDVYSIAVNAKGFMFVGGYGFYRSTNGGSNWTFIDLEGVCINSLAINAYNGNIYAITKNGTLCSNNGGETWNQLNMFPLSNEFQCIAFNSKGHIFAGHWNDIYRSTDNGTSWTYVYMYTLVKALAIDSNDNIYAGTIDGVYMSTDNGDNWEHFGLQTRVIALAINSNGHIFAGTNDGIYRSIDNGKNWTFFDFDTPVRSLDINSQGIIFAKTNSRLFRSVDNGDNWFQIEFQESVCAFFIDSNDCMYIAGKGVFRSTDNGDNWSALNINIFNSVNYLAANSLGHIFAVASENLYRSKDNGNNWETITSLNSRVFSIGINSRDVVFTSTDNGVFRSSDNGYSWVQANNGLDSRVVNSFALNANGHIFAGISLSCLWIGGIYRSTDNGDHWTRISPVEYVNSIEIVTREYIVDNRLVQFEQIFAITAGGIIRSADNGDSWTGTDIKDFAWIGSIDSNPNGHIFITTDAGIYRSTDNGGSWTAINSEDYVRFIAINSKGHIYAVTYSTVIRSTNNVKDWEYINYGLGNYDVQCLAFGSEGYTFAGTRGGGVFRTFSN